jgi:hypothetical protein
MRKGIVGLAVVTLITAVANRAEAQFRFGANLSWASDTDLGIGARASFGLGGLSAGRPIEGLVTFDYFFPDDVAGVDSKYWEASVNGIYRLAMPESSLAPYLGAGVLLGHSSVDAGSTVCNIADCSNNNIGLNLIGGFRFKGGPRFLPFAEARFEVAEESQLVLTVGAFFGKP